MGAFDQKQMIIKLPKRHGCFGALDRDLSVICKKDGIEVDYDGGNGIDSWRRWSRFSWM